jgi:hypothetical protein
MKNIIIHIGPHKTGSSSIQQSLKKVIPTSNFTYANLIKDANHSKLLFTCFSSNYRKYHFFRNTGMSISEIDLIKDKYLIKLREYVSNTASKNIFFSAEDVSLIDYEGKKNLINFFQYFNFTLKIFYFYRKPSELASSLLQQRIKGGLTNLVDLENRYSYSAHLKAFFDHLHPRDIIIFDYHAFSLSKGGVCNAIYDYFQLNDVMPSNVNLSLTEPATKAIYILNNMIGTPKNKNELVLRQNFIKLISSLYDYKIFNKFKIENLENLIFKKENLDFFQKFGISYEKLNYNNSDLDFIKIKKFLNDFTLIHKEKLIEYLRSQTNSMLDKYSNNSNELILLLYKSIKLNN